MKMKMKNRVLINFFVALQIVIIGISSCGNAGTGKKTETTDAKKESNDTGFAKKPDIVELTSEQMKVVGIELGTIEQKNLNNVVKASGQLTVPPESKAVVNALVGGVIRKINVVEGQNITQGYVVATIENPEFVKLQQDYLTSKDNIVYLEQEFERQRQLKEADAGIGKVYQQASANYAAEKSKLLTLEKQLQQIHINPRQISRGKLTTHIPVLTPISGTVGHIKLSVGTYTDASSPIMEIVNNATIYADLLVYENDISKIKKGQKVNFTLTNQDNKQAWGQVYGINKSFEPENKAVIVHAIINNATALNLLAGMYVSALIEVGKQVVPTVPKDAIVKAKDKQYIFVLEEIKEDTLNNEEHKAGDKVETGQVYTFKKVEVATGVEESGYVEVRLLNDLPPNKRIATKGAFYIYSKMQNRDTDDL